MEFYGIDISTHQKSVNWAKVKADGIQFAMLRSSFGWHTTDKQKDKMFEKHYAGAKAVGLPVGAYHYSYATSVESAIKEADYCYKAIKGKQFEYPIAYDMEEARISALGKEKVSAIAKAFCDRMESYGYYVCIYANKNWLENYFTNDVLNRYDIWLAQYYTQPTYKGKFAIWQKSSKGSVNGIKGNVDIDISYKDYPKIIKDAKLNGLTEQPKKTIDEIAHEVLDGKWNNGAVRKRLLEEAGYSYAMVQARVNTLLGYQKPSNAISVGNTVKVISGSKDLNTGKRMAMWAYARKYKVKSISGNRAVLTYNGTIVTAQDIKNLKKV